MTKNWQLASPINPEVTNKFPEINPVVLQLLHNRKLMTQEEIDQFLNPNYDTDLHDPFLFRHMHTAVDRIIKAVKDKEKVLVYGDYDADGVCSSALVIQVLEQIGLPDVDLYIPFRDKEGYGLSSVAVKEIIDKEYKLVITTDCGISNFNEVGELNQAGIDVIVTDHHQPPSQLPNALAIINPTVHEDKYPFARLSGTGVAFKLIQALLIKAKKELELDIVDGSEKWFLDFVAIATVADMMDLLDENRTMVKYGLTVLQKTRNLGLQALAKVSSTSLTDMTTRKIGFQIAPRLNAAGRINHATVASKLLLTKSESEAMSTAIELNQVNTQRQQKTEVMVKEILSQVEPVNQDDMIIIAQGDWLTGLLGLAAGKITNQYYKPSLVIGKNLDGDFVCSGRSIEQFDLTKAFEQCADFLVQFGGHKQAGGCTIKPEHIDDFKEKMAKIAQEELSDQNLKPSLFIEKELTLDQIDWELYNQIAKFEPYGISNQEPVFVCHNLVVNNIDLLGAEQQHVKITASQNGFKKKFIGFGCGEFGNLISKDQEISIAFTIGVNEWNGNRELQLTIIDIHYDN